MQSAFEILSAPQFKPTVKRNSQRDVVMQDIYAIYTSEKQRVLRKKCNWKKYCLWLRENKVKHSKVTIDEFKKSKHFIKELPIGTIAIFLARYKVDRLYQILSEAKDINNRNGSASAFIISSRFI
jgi:hypothetical protein